MPAMTPDKRRAEQKRGKEWAGRLLYQPVWNLDISDRSAEELLA